MNNKHKSKQLLLLMYPFVIIWKRERLDELFENIKQFSTATNLKEIDTR